MSLIDFINESLDDQKTYSDAVTHIAMNELGISEKSFREIDKLMSIVKPLVNSSESTTIINRLKDKRIEYTAEVLYDRLKDQIKTEMG